MIETITQYKELILLIISSVTAVIVAVITAYRQVIATLKDTEELKAETMNLITKAENSPRELLHSLVNKPEINNLTDGLNKAQIVAHSLQERRPDLLRKLKINNLSKTLDFVQTVYNLGKPLVKLLRK